MASSITSFKLSFTLHMFQWAQQQYIIMGSGPLKIGLKLTHKSQGICTNKGLRTPCHLPPVVLMSCPYFLGGFPNDQLMKDENSHT